MTIKEYSVSFYNQTTFCQIKYGARLKEYIDTNGGRIDMETMLILFKNDIKTYEYTISAYEDIITNCRND